MTPERSSAIINKVVATGRWMKGRERFIEDANGAREAMGTLTREVRANRQAGVAVDSSLRSE